MTQQRLIVTCLLILTAFFFFTGLYYLRGFLVPIFYGMVLSMLFVPLCRYFEKKGFPRGLGIACCLLLFVVVVTSLGMLVYTQLVDLTQDFRTYGTKAWQKFSEIQQFIDRVFHVSPQDQTGWLKQHYEKILTFSSGVVTYLLKTISGGLELFLIVLLYMFLFLLFRTRFKLFVLKAIPKQNPAQVLSLLTKTEVVTRNYMSGILKLMVVMGVLNTIGFYLCGVKQALFWGLLRGLLNAIPYVGPIVSAVFPFVSSVIHTNDLIHPLSVLGVIVITQIIQDLYVLPFMVGSNIRLNALTTIVSVFVGSMLWGIHGMILLLPLIGVLKVLCDSIPALRALGYLLGDEKEPEKGELTN